MIEMIDIQEKIFYLAAKYTLNKDVVVSLSSTFKEDLEFDSLSLTEFIIACEDELCIEIDLDDPKAYSIKTLKDLIEIIEQNYT